MTSFPILPHFDVHPDEGQTARVNALAERLVSERPGLLVADSLRPLAPEHLGHGPSLHLDDLAAIPLFGRSHDVSYLEDRARFRAGEGDFVASCTLPDRAFEQYCEDHLGLGSVTWMYPRSERGALAVASACWMDGDVRKALVNTLRSSNLESIHPHMGNSSVWALALLLRRASHRPLKVIAPHPALTSCVNDKLWFAETVTRLFGESLVPRTAHAYNFATLSMLVQSLASDAQSIVVKLPDSAGGSGNVVLDAGLFRKQSLGETRSTLKNALRQLEWRGRRGLLVSSWETAILSAPSTQLWVPPPADGPPIVEGLFEQMLEGRERAWVGSTTAQIPEALEQEVVDRSWLLASLYQRLGYIGRCSFDLLLVGDDIESSRIEFLECNGRWGGTSSPMTLMNRLFGDFTAQPYATRECNVEGLDAVRFEALLEFFAGDLFDVRTGQGEFVFFNPGGLVARSGIDVIALGKTRDDAVCRLEHDIPLGLQQLVKEHSKSVPKLN